MSEANANLLPHGRMGTTLSGAITERMDMSLSEAKNRP